MLNPWLRAANPFNTPRAIAEAQRAARVAAFALVASGVMSLITSGLMALHPEWMTTIMDNQYTRMGLPAEQVEMQRAMMSSIMPTMMVVGMLVGVAICLVLAWAQWKYMTRAIPIIMLALLAYSALMGVIGVSTGQYAGLGPVYGVMSGASWVVQCVCAVMYVAAIRGAFVLHRLKREP